MRQGARSESFQWGQMSRVLWRKWHWSCRVMSALGNKNPVNGHDSAAVESKLDTQQWCPVIHVKADISVKFNYATSTTVSTGGTTVLQTRAINVGNEAQLQWSHIRDTLVLHWSLDNWSDRIINNWIHLLQYCSWTNNINCQSRLLQGFDLKKSAKMITSLLTSVLVRGIIWCWLCSLHWTHTVEVKR